MAPGPEEQRPPSKVRRFDRPRNPTWLDEAAIHVPASGVRLLPVRRWGRRRAGLRADFCPLPFRLEGSHVDVDHPDHGHCFRVMTPPAVFDVPATDQLGAEADLGSSIEDLAQWFGSVTGASPWR
jgi:hypothetical protein